MTLDPVNDGVEQFAPGAFVFDSFEVISSIGSGGMGAVYKVHHRVLDVDMALKVLNKGAASKADFMRFQNEARTLSKLSHPHVARVYTFGMENNTPYLAMDFVEGQTLEQYLDQHGTLSLEEFVVIFFQICSGLAHAHSRNIIHRDLKPGNIILSEDDNENIRAVIVDFGVAKLQEEMQRGILTQSGAFVGSPLCCSPEQISGEPITPAADMYALGCTMFDALTGEPPFFGDSVLETLAMHRQNNPPLEKLNSDIPVKLREAVASLLQKKPVDRQWSAKELADALDSGRLIRQTEQDSEVAVTIPPRLRRIVSNEATAARIKLKYDVPDAKPSKSPLTKKEKVTFVSVVSLVVLGLFSYLCFLSWQEAATTNSVPSAVRNTFTDTEKTYASSKAAEYDLILADGPAELELASDYKSALRALNLQQYSSASLKLNKCLEKVGSNTNLVKTKRVDILGSLAVCAYLPGKTKEFKKYFRMYLDCEPESLHGIQIVRLARDIATAYILCNNNDGAFNVYRKFIELEESRRFPEVEGCLLTDIGVAEGSRGNPEAAFKAFDQACKIFKTNNLTNEIFYQELLTRWGTAEFVAGKLQLAKAHFEEADRMVAKDEQEGPWKDQKTNLVICNQSLANIAAQQGDFSKARVHQQKALDLSTMLDSNPKSAGTQAMRTFLHQIEDAEKAVKALPAKTKTP